MEEFMLDLSDSGREWVTHRSKPIFVDRSLMGLCHLSQTKEDVLLPGWLNPGPDMSGKWLAYPVHLESREHLGRCHRVLNYLPRMLRRTGINIGTPVEERFASVDTPRGEVVWVQSAVLDDGTMLFVRIVGGGDDNERVNKVLWMSGGEERQVLMRFERKYQAGCHFCVARRWRCQCKWRGTVATPRSREKSPIEFWYFSKQRMAESWFVDGLPVPEGSKVQCGPSPSLAFSCVVYAVNHIKESSRFDMLDEHLAGLDKRSPRILCIRDSSSSSAEAGTAAVGPERSWCADCGKSFSRRFDLQRHVTAVHGGEKKFQCSLCTRKFALQQNLMTHIANVHERRRNVPCPTCDVMFSTRYKMRLHMRRVHQKERSYACLVCGYSCFQRSDLQRHMGRVHGATSTGGSGSDSNPARREDLLNSAGSAEAGTGRPWPKGR